MPTSPFGSVVVVIVTPATIVMDRGWAAEVAPVVSLTVTLKDALPAVGVPLMTPVDEFKERPAGSDPLLTVQLL